jgi:hypothetical protein
MIRIFPRAAVQAKNAALKGSFSGKYISKRRGCYNEVQERYRMI